MTSDLRKRRLVGSTALLAGMALVATGCAGAGAGGGGGGDDEQVTLTLATVNNPQMKDMEELKGAFEEEHPNISVNFIQMEENDLRNAVTQDVATQGGQYDIVTVGSYEVPIWGQNDWLVDLTDMAADTEGYDVDDILPPVRTALTVDDKLYAVPFYGESSFLMYNKEILDAAGITLSDHPTWQEVADAARAVNSDDVAGICLRGKPGWGEFFAPGTTVVQTFGGNWFDEDWNATVDSPEFTEAIQFYTDLVKEAGQSDPVSTGFTECLNLFTQGNAAIWYDATSAAGSVESPDLSQVAGKVGYTHAPVVETEESGWLWSWNLAIPKTSKKQEAAWEFVSWATSKEYIQLVGEELGWSRVPPGSRESTYEIPEYQEEAGAFAGLTKDIMLAVNPEQPGVDPQPWVGIQYVTIPEFQDLGNQVSQEVAEVFAGRKTVEQALAEGQKLAEAAGEAQK
ncbi:sugar ABC transporter substrate-binding protein [Leucobacter sp. CSA1]|uniref:Sugar ABC transporter substrate-binding protein n=1 Tax=Leucobacter chromiisoli TaxID=2796471 RepID=A0A934Q4V4_9MICO|nr:sugar ABC transporter substrate-binding protein [Leucobacter chromiisoli]MBK0418455.1 sugar ABC transporter substrate-binding protein [Leucobacter chromiisoli]